MAVGSVRPTGGLRGPLLGHHLHLALLWVTPYTGEGPGTSQSCDCCRPNGLADARGAKPQGARRPEEVASGVRLHLQLSVPLCDLDCDLVCVKVLLRVMGMGQERQWARLPASALKMLVLQQEGAPPPRAGPGRPCVCAPKLADLTLLCVLVCPAFRRRSSGHSETWWLRIGATVCG